MYKYIVINVIPKQKKTIKIEEIVPVLKKLKKGMILCTLCQASLTELRKS